jgi:hypothetical protein
VKQQREERKEEDMSNSTHTAGPALDAVTVGRIASLNMTSEGGRLSYETLAQDLNAANDCNCEAGCFDHCHLWA